MFYVMEKMDKADLCFMVYCDEEGYETLKDARAAAEEEDRYDAMIFEFKTFV